MNKKEANKFGYVLVFLFGLGLTMFALSASAQIEPNAGQWKTWVLTSGDQLRLPPPPKREDSKEEIETLEQLAVQRDAAALDLIKFWDAGAPSYQWNQMTINEIKKFSVGTVRGERALALVHVAIYDAMVAAWDSKYAYNRPRPSRLDKDLTTVIPNPHNPSYPSEHAVAAGAASAVLAYLFPTDAQAILAQADAAGRSRLLAGVQYPTDVQAGFDLGHAVAALVIARAQSDGSSAIFSGTIPNGPCNWKGINPAEPLAGTWKTWVLSSGSEFRPGPPPACDSAQETAELAEVKSFPRILPAAGAAFVPESGGFFWQGRAVAFWSDLLDKKIFEYRMENNAPRAARAYVSGGNAGALSYLFPQDAAFFQAQATEAAESRIWSGIHFRSDINAGLALAQKVTQAVVDRVQQDGSQ